jgi:hypothetical protein
VLDLVHIQENGQVNDDLGQKVKNITLTKEDFKEAKRERRIQTEQTMNNSTIGSFIIFEVIASLLRSVFKGLTSKIVKTHSVFQVDTRVSR